MPKASKASNKVTFHGSNSRTTSSTSSPRTSSSFFSILVALLVAALGSAIVLLPQLLDIPTHPPRPMIPSNVLTKRSERGADGANDNVPVAPAPWTLTVAEAYLFPYNVVNKTLHALYPVADPENNVGTGMSSLMIIRTAQSDRTDELILTSAGLPKAGTAPPGAPNPRTFSVFADRGVPLIWVSTEASLRNGRRNWGIRKELADFTFTPVVAGGTTTGGSGSGTAIRVTVRERYGERAGSVLLDATVRESALPAAVAVPVYVPAGLPGVGTALRELRIDEEGDAVAGGGLFLTATAWSGWVRPASLVELHAVGAGFVDLRKVPSGGPGVLFRGRVTFNQPAVLASHL
ncbi:hypothetical protein DFJ73DRAFT_960554 [Zopfochytrium polystomum]|nr:hypothetical protein DFJ73DRAFT_960554 [Zopfochytrium polystomum]